VLAADEQQQQYRDQDRHRLEDDAVHHHLVRPDRRRARAFAALHIVGRALEEQDDTADQSDNGRDHRGDQQEGEEGGHGVYLGLVESEANGVGMGNSSENSTGESGAGVLVDSGRLQKTPAELVSLHAVCASLVVMDYSCGRLCD